tara:strand:+ start:61 stop:399 length:339 start_codon:yes stop_codon:yes gene_type:complete
MAVSKLRLALSLTSIKRRFEEDDGFFNLLTQDGIFIQSQRGEFIVTQDEVNAPDFVDISDPLTDQAGNLLVIQNGVSVITLNQDFDTQGDSFETQDGRDLITQDGRGLITQK